LNGSSKYKHLSEKAALQLKLDTSNSSQNIGFISEDKFWKANVFNGH
jgi:hypothetical protein